MKIKLPRTRTMTKKQVRELLAGAESVIDREISDRSSFEALRFSDDAVLLMFENGRGILYYSRAELLEMMKEMDARVAEGPKHILAGLLPQGEAFASEAPRLAAEFADMFGLPPETIEQDLEGLDQVIRQRRAARKLYTADNFPRLLAYLGETVRRSAGAQWKMILSGDGRIWEPWLVDKSGRKQSLWLALAKELHEWGPDKSIEAVGYYYAREARGPRSLA